MKKRKVVIAICAAVAFIGAIVLVQMSRRHKAIALAKEYAAQKYDFDVTYVDLADRYWSEPSLHYGYFGIKRDFSIWNSTLG